MGRRFLFLALSFVTGFLLLAGVAHGQEDTTPEISIEWPNEGETLYAGPTSLLYSVPIKGRVSGVADDDFPLTVELEIVQDERVVESDSQVLSDNGNVEFFVTVNPEGSDGQFPAEQSGCATSCHFGSEMSLPAGPMELQLAIVEPVQLADVVDERHIVVDRSAYATIPVTLLQEGGGPAPEGVNVTGATQIYLWRARRALAATDNQGQAQLKVEALSQAPTEYRVQVKPTIVDGVLYEGIGEERVTLAPGAGRGEAVELTVSARQGQLSGQLSAAAPGSPQIWAVCLPDGRSFRTPVDADGAFQFEDLPLRPYRLMLDPLALADMGMDADSTDVDLTERAERQVTVSVRETAASVTVIRGAVADEQENPLPFAWVAAGEGNRFAPVLPDSGRFLLSGQAPENHTLFVRAPGYYSRAYAWDADEGERQAIALAPQPETRFLPWGQGAVTVPAGSDVEVEGQVMRMQRGWLWGEGQEREPLVVEAGEVRLTISAGRFALERGPQRGWFYLLEGAARAEHVASGREIALQAPVMLNLNLGPELVAAPYEPVALRALQDVGEAPLADTWQPTPGARLRDGLARLGIGAAQAVTFLTYALILLSLIVVPLGYVFYRRRRS
ncbi:MAG: carboxypeptidase-like regulatory domain-containing protein [Chloroflexota bacterium]